MISLCIKCHPAFLLGSASSLVTTMSIRQKKVKLAAAKTNKKQKKKALPKPVHTTSPKKRKRSESLKYDGDENPTKKPCASGNERGHRLVRNRRYQSRFTPIDEQWQCTACHDLGLRFVRRCDLDEGGPDVPLTRPRRVRSILGDGNCLFRSLSYIITGSETQYTQVREAILNHLVHTEDFMIGHHIRSEYSSVVEYIRGTNMDRDGHMLNTTLCMYNTISRTWSTYGPHNVDLSLSKM